MVKQLEIIYIEDLSSYILELIKSNSWNDIYNIGSGQGYSINEIISNIEKITNKNIKVIYKEKRSVDISKNILNVEKINKVVKNNKIHSLDEGLRKTWNFLKREHSIGLE